MSEPKSVALGDASAGAKSGWHGRHLQPESRSERKSVKIQTQDRFIGQNAFLVRWLASMDDQNEAPSVRCCW